MVRLSFIFVLALSALGAESPHGLPTHVLPDGLGVNIHFTDPKPGEMKMLADAGFRFVRMDFAWPGTEKTPGVYDFSAYDRLFAALDEYHLRAVLILDYNNALYDQGLSPHTDEGRGAFARWAAAAVVHFKGRGVLWEMYNEPNISFWKPAPNVDDYVKLALATGKALRDAAPDEIYIGPASSQIAMPFLESCFKGGVLEYFSAVSTHPYRQGGPERVIPEYRALRRLIAANTGKGKTVPILSGEWGYSSAWAKFNDEQQGKMLPREYLINIFNEIPLSIWYDWRDDGKDPKEQEHHFGTVNNEFHKDRDPVYDPKPAYLAARTLLTFVDGYTYSKRLALGSEADYVLLFSKENSVRIAAWTDSATPHDVIVPASPGTFTRLAHTGEKHELLTADQKGLSLSLTDAPQYLEPREPNDLLRIAAAMQRAPLEIVSEAPKSYPLNLELKNPLSKPIELRRGNEHTTIEPGATAKLPVAIAITREPENPVRLEWEVTGVGAFAQETLTIATNPLQLHALPSGKKSAVVRVEDPSGQAFNGELLITDAQAASASERKRVHFKTGETGAWVEFELKAETAAFGVKLLESDGSVAVTLPFEKFQSIALNADAYTVVPDGDMKVVSEQSLSAAPPADDSHAPLPDALKLTYRFDDGWKFVRVTPKADAQKKIDGAPRRLGLWLYGDESGNVPRLRFTDSTNQTFQPTAEAIRWKGWRYVSFRLDGIDEAHWGGDNDGRVHYPIHWDSILLLDNSSKKKIQGEIFLCAPALTE